MPHPPPPTRPRNQKAGFSLVELSIVLVIIGLLVGGVLAGRSLIRASELRSVNAQYQSYVAAVHAFRDKYFALPGDMANAQSFWGVAHADPATCTTTASTTTATCNGNADGLITPTALFNEPFRFWQHLANAGMVEGLYNGITQGGTSFSATSANSPLGKVGGGLWYTHTFGSQLGLNYVFDGDYGNVLLYGGPLPNNYPMALLFTPQELWNMDTKLDDGKPATGKMVVRVLSSQGLSVCTDTADNTLMTASYLLSSTTKACNPFFRRQF